MQGAKHTTSCHRMNGAWPQLVRSISRHSFVHNVSWEHVRVMTKHTDQPSSQPQTVHNTSCQLCSRLTSKDLTAGWSATTSVIGHDLAKFSEGLTLKKGLSLPVSWQNGLQGSQGSFIILNAETFAEGVSFHSDHDAQMSGTHGPLTYPVWSPPNVVQCQSPGFPADYPQAQFLVGGPRNRRTIADIDPHLAARREEVGLDGDVIIEDLHELVLIKRRTCRHVGRRRADAHRLPRWNESRI